MAGYSVCAADDVGSRLNLVVRKALRARMLALLAIVLSVAAASPAPPGAREVASRVDAYVKPYLEMHAFSGTVLVARRGRVLVSRGYGLADVPSHRPASPDTKYGIGSITKTMTAAAIELLAQRNVVVLSDPVSKYLPGFAHGDRITIVNLLDHSSGLKDYYSWHAYASGRDTPLSRDGFLAQAAAEPLDFAPGSNSSYSNTGYYVLAAIVERAGGLPYDQFVQRELFAPLGMKQSGELRDGTPVDGLATGYDPGFPPSGLQPSGSMSRTWLEGSGSVYSTAADLYRWLEGVRRRSVPDVHGFPYPYGWSRRPRHGRDVLEQNGRIPIGYASYAGLYEKDDVVVVVLSNIQAEVTEQIGVDLAAIALGEPYRVPEVRRLAPPPADPAFFRAYAGLYEVAVGLSLTVRAVPWGLLLAGPDGALLPLDHEGTDRFFFRPLYVPVLFERDKLGRITGLDWNGQFKARRAAEGDSHE